jgi:hypothetical protein
MYCRHKSTSGNKVLPKAGLNGFDWEFVQSSTFVLRLNLCAKMPLLRQAPTRYPIVFSASFIKLACRQERLQHLLFI